MSITGLAAFLPKSRNRLASAVIAASSVRQSSAIRAQRLTRQGYGQASLTGPYTGAESTLVEVEVTSATGTSAIATTPVFSGAGNGTLTGPTVAGATPAQTFTITLKDLGTTTTPAGLDLGAAKVRAVSPDAGGNSVFLTVDTSGLVLTAQNKALLAPWAAGTASQTGDQWDFGGLPLLADGTYNAATPAIVFGTDPQIFRPHKVFVNGQWEHHLTPAPPREVPRGTNAYTLSGSISVTVSDGVTPEVYSGVTTLYSFMTAIASSLLIQPDSVVVDDRSPGGMGAAWLSLRTTPYVLPPILSGSKYVTGLDNLALGTAPYYTEEVAFECVDNERIGQERWSVTGTVSGAHADAYTDYAYSSGPVAFTIPIRPAETTGGALKGEIVGQYVPVDTASTNRVCIHNPIVGALGTDKTIKFVWTERPVDECPCENLTYTGAPSEECLGLPIPETTVQEGTMDPAIQTRQDLLIEWLATESTTSVLLEEIDSSTDTFQIIPEFREERLRKSLGAVFLAALHEPGVAASATALAAWDTYFGVVAPGVRFELAQIATTSVNIEPIYRIVFVTAEAIPGGAETFTGWKIVEYTGVKTRTLYYTNIGWVESYGGTMTPDPSLLNIATAQIEVNRLIAVHQSLYQAIDDAFVARYERAMDIVRSKAGIVLGKTDSTPLTQGGACWTDTGAAAFWADPTGYYLPMFNGVYYTSARLKDGEVISTKEFGLAAVAGCEDKLQVGDELIITISGAGTAKTYQVGDKFVVPIINAGNAYLTGGITGNDTHTWGVVGTVAGTLADYAVVHGAELPYSAGGLGFTIYRGGIPNALGDKWQFDVLGGQFRWRRDGGAWNGPADIDGASTSLGDGLSLTFTPNKSPSYVSLDQFAWDVIQPYAPSEAIAPSPVRGWEWSGATATLTADLGTAQPIDAVGLVHRLPTGATATISGSSDNFASTDWSEALDMSARARVTALSATQTSRYIRLSLAGATGGQVLWAWAGMVLQNTQYKSITPSINYARTDSSGLVSSRLLRGKAASAELEFALLTPTQLDEMRELFDEMAEDDAPILFVPNLGASFNLPHVFGQLGGQEIGEDMFVPGASGLRFKLEGVAV